MNESQANPVGLPAHPPTGEGWPRRRWAMLIAVTFAAQIMFLFAFGEHRRPVARSARSAPELKLAPAADELLALNDPTLFALPHRRDFGSALWLSLPDVEQPFFRWTENPRWLELSGASLGAAFMQFMQTNVFPAEPLDFKPGPQLRVPALPVSPELAEKSTLLIAGQLAERRLPNTIQLPDWPFANLIAPSVVQVLVDPAGNVVSAVLLPPGTGYAPTDQYEPADQRAVEIARTLRFKPGSDLTLGRLVFHWHTVPVPATAPATMP